MKAGTGNRSARRKHTMRCARQVTPTMQRWIEKFGEIPVFSTIGARAGYSDVEVGYVMREQRHTPHIQEAVAKAAGMGLIELFGDAAWPRVGARFLARRLEERRASA